MPMDRLVELLLHQWQNATLMDYGHSVLAIILIGWIASRAAH